MNHLNDWNMKLSNPSLLWPCLPWQFRDQTSLRILAHHQKMNHPKHSESSLSNVSASVEEPKLSALVIVLGKKSGESFASNLEHGTVIVVKIGWHQRLSFHIKRRSFKWPSFEHLLSGNPSWGQPIPLVSVGPTIPGVGRVTVGSLIIKPVPTWGNLRTLNINMKRDWMLSVYLSSIS